LTTQLTTQTIADKKAAETLRGMLGFARSTCFGRCGGLALHFLGRVISGEVRQVAGHDAEHLTFWPNFLRNSPPRTVKAKDDRRPALIFTDGAEEGEGKNKVVGVGGILVDPETTTTDDLFEGSPPTKRARRDGEGRRAFGGQVPSDTVEEWRRTAGRDRVIHQAELMPAWLAIDLWGRQLHGRRVIVFVDNDAAKGALIKGGSRVEPSAGLAAKFWEVAARERLDVWVDRVASAANPSDDPSRNEWAWLQRHGFKIDTHSCVSQFR